MFDDDEYEELDFELANEEDITSSPQFFEWLDQMKQYSMQYIKECRQLEELEAFEGLNETEMLMLSYAEAFLTLYHFALKNKWIINEEELVPTTETLQ